MSAVLNLLFIEAYPLWGVVVIYALTAQGREQRSSPL